MSLAVLVGLHVVRLGPDPRVGPGVGVPGEEHHRMATVPTADLDPDVLAAGGPVPPGRILAPVAGLVEATHRSPSRSVRDSVTARSAAVARV